MAAVTFVPTVIDAPEVDGVRRKKARYSLQLPDAASGWLAAGLAWDLSAGFDVITEAHFYKGKKGYQFELTGTADSSGKGHTSSTNKILGYYGDNNNANDGPAIAVPDATDLSAVTALEVVVYGY
jgi:hypothetical protein